MSKYIEIIPKKLEQDFLKTEGIPGVYVWGYYEKNDYFIPLYVGKSRNVYERLIQHYCRFKSGEYCIFNKHDLVDIYCDKQVKNPKKVYAPISFRSVYSLAINTNQEHIFMINNFAFRYIEILVEEIRKQAECYLADTADRNNLITKVNIGNSGSLSAELKEELREMLKSCKE